MGDQARMPFTMAVVHEVQRFGDIAPLGLPHMTSRDIEVQGFLIPKVRDHAHHQPVIGAEGRDHLEEALLLPPRALP
uniref:Uncharacterized protein n=1 Tax=Equus asinus TaxID=9793 RepID=A0A8C4KX48_EQUAS